MIKGKSINLQVTKCLVFTHITLKTAKVNTKKDNFNLAKKDQRYLSPSKAITVWNSELSGGTASMQHLSARYFPKLEGVGLPRVISVTFRISLINFRGTEANHVNI